MSLIDEAQEEAKADMTPMIDCVFLMVIFFLCIDFKILEARLPAYLPRDKGGIDARADPQEKLSVKIFSEVAGTREPRIAGMVGRDPRTGRAFPIRRQGHTIYWQVGPERIDSLEQLAARLKAVYDDKGTWQPDQENPRARKPIPIVIEPYPGTFYDDVARTVDAVKAAKFEQVDFGGGLGATKG